MKKILYLDCSMGAAGDMLAAALLELLPDRQGFLDRFNALGIPRVTAAAEPSVKCGVTGTRFHVSVDGVEEDERLHEHHEHGQHHHHSGLREVERIVADLRLEPAVEADVLAVYRSIAEAESAVHGEPAEHIHFHEVGTMDAIADVAAVCLLMHALAPDEVAASPVNVGGGTIQCAHGVLPVPAPATALLLRGIPMYGGAIQSELCTPTGAALLRHFVKRFGPLPLMRGAAIGCGMGKKDFPQANCVRAILGESEGAADEIVELSCDLDDMTGEELGFAMERLFDAGARDVFTSAVQMKKNRPGTLLRVLCTEETRGALVEAIFRYTTTLGVRENRMRRYVLERREETLDTPCGAVRRKTSTGYGATRSKLEYEDLARIARERGVSVAEARRLVGDV